MAEQASEETCPEERALRTVGTRPVTISIAAGRLELSGPGRNLLPAFRPLSAEASRRRRAQPTRATEATLTSKTVEI